MASKKYLSLDEVTARLSLSTEQVNKIREEGRLRGFADRGTWKFKADDVEEFARSRQADSAPDVPIIDDFDDQSIVAPSGVQAIGSGTSVVSDDDDAVGDQPTVIRQDASGSAVLDDEPLLASSDSDVRLVLPEGFSAIDSNPDVSVQGDSDSDVQLIDQTDQGTPGGARSDSDVSLISDEIDTVSDVRLLSGDDVPAGQSGSDSDVSLVSGKPSSTSIFEDEEEEEVRPLAAGDSGISLESIADSGIALEDSSFGRRGGPGVESSIISLSEDSGIALAGDSVVSSGIDVGSPSDSGIALEALNEGNPTQPMMQTTGRRPVDSDDTQFELDSGLDDSEFELAAGSGSSIDNDTSVILFEDDDEFSASSPSGVSSGVDDYIASQSDDVVELDEEFDAYEDVGSGVAMSDDDDLEFEAADEDFDESFQAGESQSDFAPATQRVAVAPEAEISGLTFTGLAATSALLAVCGMLMFDLVRSMWGYNDPMLSSWLLSTTKDLF